MDSGGAFRDHLPRFNDEWNAERLLRAMLLPYGSAGRSADELQDCPHCHRTYYRSNGGACPRCGGAVPREAPRGVRLHFGIS